MSTITIELDNLAAEEQETIKRLAKKKKKPYWVPKNGETYFRIDEYGFIDYTQNDEKDDDNFAISIGNCFRTREEAEEAKTRLQMQTKWKRLSLEAGEAENPWDCEHGHYFAYWDCVDEKIGNDFHIKWINGATNFPSAESIKAAIAELGEENVKNYIFGVEEWQN